MRDENKFDGPNIIDKGWANMRMQLDKELPIKGKKFFFLLWLFLLGLSGLGAAAYFAKVSEKEIINKPSEIIEKPMASLLDKELDKVYVTDYKDRAMGLSSEDDISIDIESELINNLITQKDARLNIFFNNSEYINNVKEENVVEDRRALTLNRKISEAGHLPIDQEDVLLENSMFENKLSVSSIQGVPMISTDLSSSLKTTSLDHIASIQPRVLLIEDRDTNSYELFWTSGIGRAMSDVPLNVNTGIQVEKEITNGTKAIVGIMVEYLSKNLVTKNQPQFNVGGETVNVNMLGMKITSGVSFDVLPRVDVSGKFSYHIMKQLSSEIPFEFQSVDDPSIGGVNTVGIMDGSTSTVSIQNVFSAEAAVNYALSGKLKIGIGVEKFLRSPEVGVDANNPIYTHVGMKIRI